MMPKVHPGGCLLSSLLIIMACQDDDLAALDGEDKISQSVFVLDSQTALVQMKSFKVEWRRACPLMVLVGIVMSLTFPNPQYGFCPLCHSDPSGTGTLKGGRVLVENTAVPLHSQLAIHVTDVFSLACLWCAQWICLLYTNPQELCESLLASSSMLDLELTWESLLTGGHS
jgi:hypothetical protein